MDDARYQREAAELVAAKGIAYNKSFILLFFIAVLVAVVGSLVIIISALPGWIILGTVLGVGGAGVASGKMDALMTLGVASLAGISGIMAVIVTAYVMLGIE